MAHAYSAYYFAYFFSTALVPNSTAAVAVAAAPSSSSRVIRDSAELRLSTASLSTSGRRKQTPSTPVLVSSSSASRLLALTKPVADKYLIPPKPPRHSDKLSPALPCDDIFLNQTRDRDPESGMDQGNLRILPDNCDRLRFRIDVVRTEHRFYFN